MTVAAETAAVDAANPNPITERTVARHPLRGPFPIYREAFGGRGMAVTYLGDRKEFKKILIGEGDGRFVRKTGHPR